MSSNLSIPRLLAIGLAFLMAWSAPAQDSVTLQLKWTHAFQFAGYYAAHEQGYYHEAGLDVEIIEGYPGVKVVDEVVSGRAQFGTGSSSLLLARHEGKPVVVLAAIFQHSPLVLIALQERPTQNIHDLVGKRIMLEPQSEELLAYLAQQGILPADFTLQEHSFDYKDLIEGNTDAISAYVTYEVFHLTQAGIPFQVYSPRSVGIDFYGDNLFTSEAELRANPARVAAFREASLRGWEYAMANPEEMVELIVARMDGVHERAFYQFEAEQMYPLLRPDLIELGYMLPGRWQHIARTYAGQGMLPPDFPLDGFLYTVDPPLDWTLFTPYLLAGALLMLAISVVAFFIHNANRRLAVSLSELHETKNALEESEAQFRTVTNSSAAGIFVLQGNRFVLVNPALSAITGYDRNDLLMMDAMTLFHADERESLQKTALARQRGEAVDNRYEARILTREGRERWVDISADRVYFHGEPSSIGTVFDITERKAAEESVRRMAQHDTLTDLPNRALFSDLLDRALSMARREKKQLAVMFLDLDNFKPVNDTHGHALGDRILQLVAQRVRGAIRDSDTVGRIGGDEFVILLPVVERDEDTLGVAGKIREAIAQPFEVDGLTITISCSIGIAHFPKDGADAVELLRHADEAMYGAKEHGRNTVERYGEG